MIWCSRSDDGGTAVSFLSWEHRLWSNAGSQRQEVERLRLARSFGRDVKSCPGRQVLRCVMPGQQVLRTTDLPESSRLDGRAQGGGTVGRRGLL